ncbi:hypothetical protein [Compostibacter hankyongensis]|uniref:Uncharacterized protein n=1 Tax=Compostibacter hankyongensis TaxID=1007089 RepID=A0ABP8FWQ9_9BACT
MELHIRVYSQVRDLQEDFNARFPYLRLEFFRYPHADKKLSSRGEEIDSSTPLSQLSKSVPAVIEVNEKMTVSQTEKEFQERLGLFVQVLRKSGRIWIETSLTDHWTLEQQNSEGESMSSMHERRREPGAGESNGD